MSTWYDKFLVRHHRRFDSTKVDLARLARRRFGTSLYPAEIRVLDQAVSSLDLFSSKDEAARRTLRDVQSTEQQEVRAAFLYWLATDIEARSHLHAKGIRVFSSKVIGDLDLSMQSQLPSLELHCCTLTGTVLFEGAEIKRINITDSHLQNGMKADEIVTHGPMILHRTRSDAEVSLVGATIGGSLECNGMQIAADGDALSLDGTTIKGDLICTEEFVSRGEVRILQANIGGSALFSGAKLEAEKDALTLDKIKIGGNLVLNGGFKCSGTIRLPNCNIGGDLNFMGAEVQAVICYNMSLSGDLLWHGIQKTAGTELDLRRARIKTLRDDEASWPSFGRLQLDNLVYEDLIIHENPAADQIRQGEFGVPKSLDLAKRIEWLKRQPERLQLRPQPWVQLSRFMESTSNKTGAKHALYVFRCLEARQKPWPIRLALIAFAWLEEAPWRILFCVIPTLVIGTLIFAGASPDRSNAMIPTAKGKDAKEVSARDLDHYPRFQPFIYTLENAVPLVKLGIDDKWTPDPAHQGTAWFPRDSQLNWLGWFNSYDFLTVTRWVIILLGWFYAVILSAALTSRFKL